MSKSKQRTPQEFFESRFWEARENARFCFVVIVVAIPIVVDSMDATQTNWVRARKEKAYPFALKHTHTFVYIILITVPTILT